MQKSVKIAGPIQLLPASDFLQIVMNSYSQIFFSAHRGFALLIILVTFFDFYTGVFGLISVLASATIGVVLGFERGILKKGLLGFNSLLVGLGLGVYYTPSWYLLGIVILASLFTFFISVSMQGVIGKYNLPFLSLPFILSLWAFMLATGSFSALGINERGIFTLNELYTLGGQNLVDVYEYINNLAIPEGLSAYFISLSAILFQYSILTGFVLSIGLLIFSRIAFSLSLIGFFLAYGFYNLIGAEINIYDYSYFGFNYILSSIAIGGFFLIPSRNAYLWMILLIPFVAVLTISMNMVFLNFKLPIYSLPFNLVSLLFLYSLKFREKYSYSMSEVYFQHNSPEKNLYIFLNNKERFRYKLFIPIKLPFFGNWKVSQDDNGEYTHKGDFRYAWDFVITDDDGKQFKNEGDFTEDYFCYNKPIIAPENGFVDEVVDGIEDNVIGQSNLKDNWGNTIIIKHSDDVYSKLCHLKKGSIKVKKGDQVRFGQIIANSGNSGRSPYPHLHFQIQENPHIGSVTIEYPLSNYIEHSSGESFLRIHSKPKKNQLVSNVEASPLIVSALNFIPGQIIEFEATKDSVIKNLSWEVKVNEYNESYFSCSQTGSKAYFENDQNLFYFTYFEGDKKSDLFTFFRALFKIQKGYYQDMQVVDHFPLYLTYPGKILWFYDFISPFVTFIRSEFTISCKEIDDTMSPSKITLASENVNYFFRKRLDSRRYEIELSAGKISSVSEPENNYSIKML